MNYRQKEKQILDNILGKGIDGKGYDKRIRPSGNNDTGWFCCLRKYFASNLCHFLLMRILLDSSVLNLITTHDYVIIYCHYCFHIYKSYHTAITF